MSEVCERPHVSKLLPESKRETETQETPPTDGVLYTSETKPLCPCWTVTAPLLASYCPCFTVYHPVLLSYCLDPISNSVSVSIFLLSLSLSYFVCLPVSVFDSVLMSLSLSYCVR